MSSLIRTVVDKESLWIKLAVDSVSGQASVSETGAADNTTKYGGAAAFSQLLQAIASQATEPSISLFRLEESVWALIAFIPEQCSVRIATALSTALGFTHYA
jgi:hypothetical protein